VNTTSEVEWKFVVEPESPLKWPLEERLMGQEGGSSHMRKLMPYAMLLRRMAQQNRKLEAGGNATLNDFEVVGGRLYTGPLFVKYNGVLRGLDSPVSYLKNDMVSLVTAKEVCEKYQGTAPKWMPANGELKYDEVRKLLNMYTTTIHVINSCIVKMGKLTEAKPVYRGMSGRLFPPSFWRKNAQGVMGGVEYAFMSTTPNRSVAYQYSQDPYGIVVEIKQGMIDRGAEIAWLSQYPHEAEVLFAPLAGLEMTSMRIDTHPISNTHIIIVTMRVSINLTNPTIEQVVQKRRKIIENMGTGLIMEVRSALNKRANSHETESYIRLLDGLFSERPLRHDATWYNDDLNFEESVSEVLRLKREVMVVPTLETKKLEGDAVAQLLGETLATKAKVPFVPAVLFKEFGRLRVLSLDAFGGIEALPDTLGGLASLTTLNLRDCERLQAMPASLGRLKALNALNMPSCKELKELPSSIGRLEALTLLDLSFCRQLIAVPAEVGRLHSLVALKLQQCSSLPCLPESLGQLSNLKTLIIYGCTSIERIPDQIGELERLEELNCRSCSGLKCLPDTLGRGLPSLTSLDLTMCKGLTALPETLGLCSSLQSLYLGNCLNIKVLPETITRLRNLTTLNLYNCGGLSKLPDNFHLATSLRILSLQGCENLYEVPPSVAMMPALQTLTLWNCMKLEVMPDMSAIPKLQIDGVPEQLADWEAEQKRKRAEQAAADRKGGQAAAAAKVMEVAVSAMKGAVAKGGQAAAGRRQSIAAPSKPAAAGE